MRFAARKKIVDRLEAAGLIEKRTKKKKKDRAVQAHVCPMATVSDAVESSPF